MPQRPPQPEAETSTIAEVGYFSLEVSLLENYSPCAVTVCLGRCRSSIKAAPSPHSLIHSSRLHLLENKVQLYSQNMSCYNTCLPCQPCGPTPLANSCNEPCVRQCQDSTVVIQPSPVVVTLPGPILSSFPQNTAVGSSTSAAVGSILSSEGVPINSGGFGLGGLGLCGIGSGYCGRRCFPC
ncbi:feather keratin 1-like [Nyctibius grandis]|uniref:feather keratin 1-like n=1 Tax=Nyctibius grandis TaxID=48427 RepID=UPI0035BC496A